ncbi:MAG TPA: tripartite tricarboxylate transporter substrate binding protein [Noviherbaspirillum sp.]|nr:tripartite tricarboxylate transporter substrate binding protein [Noviherbaspirillum sp.]
MNIRSLARCRVAGLLALALALPALPAAAQLGEKPVRMIVPLTAGSTVDIVARLMGNSLSTSLGSPVIVENLVGAGGVTGTAQLVKAPKDGMTLAMVSSNHVINPSIYKSVPFDSLGDITPISVIGTVPLVLVAHPSVPAQNLKELVALVKAKPGKINYGSAGNGSVLHLAGELLKSEAGGLDMMHVPYRGTGPLVTDLMGGQVDIGFVSVTAAASQIRSGRLRAIGVSTRTRSAILPDVPTLAEQGLPNYSFDAWLAVIGPAGLPKETVNRTHAALMSALKSAEVREGLATQGVALIGTTPDEARQFFKTELDKHAALVKQSGATLD